MTLQSGMPNNQENKHLGYGKICKYRLKSELGSSNIIALLIVQYKTQTLNRLNRDMELQDLSEVQLTWHDIQCIAVLILLEASKRLENATQLPALFHPF